MRELMPLTLVVCARSPAIQFQLIVADAKRVEVVFAAATELEGQWLVPHAREDLRGRA